MTLNITAERRVDISDFGSTWDGCYLTVKSMNPKALKEWLELATKEATGDETVDDLYGEKLKQVLVGGVIMNTGEDGKESRYKIQPEDVSDVVDALGPVYKQRALMVAAGTYGLKGV